MPAHSMQSNIDSPQCRSSARYRAACKTAEQLFKLRNDHLAK